MTNKAKIVTGIILFFIGILMLTDPVYTGMKGVIMSLGVSIFAAIGMTWIMMGTVFYSSFKLIRQD